jgi:hypothetical protein
MGLIASIFLAAYAVIVIVPTVTLAVVANAQEPDTWPLWIGRIIAVALGWFLMRQLAIPTGGGEYGNFSQGLAAIKSWTSLSILLTSIFFFVGVRKFGASPAVRGLTFAPAVASISWLVQAWARMTS